MAVGDDAQSIYSWRGANFENVLTFPERFPGTREVRIETNCSTPEILALARLADYVLLPAATSSACSTKIGDCGGRVIGTR